MKLHHIPIILSILTMVFCAGINDLMAGVSVAPAYIELDLDKKRPAGKFIIKNLGQKDERYRIKASHFILGEKGNLIKMTPDDNSLVPWLKFNPKEFNMPPKSNRSVRFVVAPKGKIPDKAYWAFLELEPLTPNILKSKNKKGSTFNVNISTSILIPIFATKGEVSYGASMKDTKVIVKKSGPAIETTVTNEGTGHLYTKMTYAVIDESKTVYKEGLMAKGFIFPGNHRTFRRRIDTQEIPKGNHKVVVVCEATQLKDAIVTEIRHTW